MLLRIHFPPELLAEVLCTATNSFQIIEIVGRDALEDLSHATHGEFRESIGCAGVIEMALEEAHQLAALSLAVHLLSILAEVFRKEVSDAFHEVSVTNGGA